MKPRTPWKTGFQVPAAFGRLCVETMTHESMQMMFLSAAFGRLCVETYAVRFIRLLRIQPPSGGCVLKLC